jgi:hypothetical protein
MLNGHSASHGLQVVTIAKTGHQQDIDSWSARYWATFDAVSIVKETYLKALVEDEPVEQPMYWSTWLYDEKGGGDARAMQVMAPIRSE